MAERKLATLSEVPEGGMICREADGHAVLLAKIEGRVHAMDNVCNHEEAPLHEGCINQEGPFLVTCPWHEAHFDVRTGKVHQDTDWAEDTSIYPVRIDGDDVWVDLP